MNGTGPQLRSTRWGLKPVSANVHGNLAKDSAPQASAVDRAVPTAQHHTAVAWSAASSSSSQPTTPITLSRRSSVDPHSAPMLQHQLSGRPSMPAPPVRRRRDARTFVTLLHGLQSIRVRHALRRWMQHCQSKPTMALRRAAHRRFDGIQPFERARLLAMCHTTHRLRNAFHRWRAEATRRSRRRYQIEAVAYLAPVSRTKHRALIFGRWCRFVRVKQCRRWQTQRLGHMRRVANFNQCRGAFRRWLRLVRFKRLHATTRYLMMRTQCRTASRCLDTLHAYAARQQKHRHASTRLHTMRVLWQLRLSAVCFFRWSRLGPLRASRRATVATLAQRTAQIRGTAAFAKWKLCASRRRAHRQLVPVRVAQIKKTLRQAVRKWKRWADRNVMARHLEQTCFEQLARRYLLSWIHRVQRLLPLCRRLKQRTARQIQLSTLRLWQRWMERGLRAVQLEQRHFVVMLQRFFIRWRYAISSTRRSRGIYAPAAAPLVHSNQRHVAQPTHSAAAVTAQPAARVNVVTAALFDDEDIALPNDSYHHYNHHLLPPQQHHQQQPQHRHGARGPYDQASW